MGKHPAGGAALKLTLIVEFGAHGRMIETSSVIEKEQGNGFYLVTLEQPAGHQCLCRAAGKLTKFRIKLLAFVIAGVMAGLAGGLLASHNQFVSPSLMHWTASANLIIMVIVGGIGLRYGGLVGAAVMLWLEEILRLYTDYWHLPLGVLLLAIVLFAPRGLAGMFKQSVTR